MKVSTRDTLVGVIGLGDLGNKLVSQLVMSGSSVVAFDQSKDVVVDKAIDPSVNARDAPNRQLKIVFNVSEVVRLCQIVHWAVPSDELHSLPLVQESTTVILHDSVMENSRAACIDRPDANRFVVVHCLMNSTGRVLVSPEFGHYQLIMDHFREIGLTPKRMKIKEHDTMMARTQGVFALLIELGVGKELDRGFKDGDLTPSAAELRAAVMHRHWTHSTTRSILRNPELKSFVAEIAKTLTGD